MSRIKKIIRNNKKLHSFARKVHKGLIYTGGGVFPEFFTKDIYISSFKRPLNLNNPKTLNEKIQFLKLKKYWNSDTISICADKYRVRNYVKHAQNNDGRNILTALYGVWDDIKKIEWDILPEKFAIKCNHGSGYNIVCHDKAYFNYNEATEKLNLWMHQRYGSEYVEQGIYNKIPRRILAEEFIDTIDNKPPADYKFFCSYGKCKFLFVACDRYDSQTKYDFYYPDWTYIPCKLQFPNNGAIKKPVLLEEMIKIAENLARPFPLVRIDLYNEMEKIIFGEMTFSNFGGLMPFYPDEYDLIFGNLFPKKEELELWQDDVNLLSLSL